MSRRGLPWQRPWQRSSERYQPYSSSFSSYNRRNSPYNSSRSRPQPAPEKKRVTGSRVPSSSGGRGQPIVIDDDDDYFLNDDLNFDWDFDWDFEEISPTPPQPEVEFLSIGRMGNDLRVLRMLTVAAKIVGVQYYRGITTPGENLLFVREPQNRYDRNAIRVDNVANIQVGQ